MNIEKTPIVEYKHLPSEEFLFQEDIKTESGSTPFKYQKTIEEKL